MILYLPNEKQYESIYAHCATRTVSAENWIEKGTQIGTIGTANGQYYAHLHLELRKDVSRPLGSGYGKNQTGYLDLVAFINRHRTTQN